MLRLFIRVIKMFFPRLYERRLLLQTGKKQICLFPFIVMLLAILRHMDVLLLLLGMNHGKQSRVAIKENPVINSEEDKLNYGNFDINSPEYQIEVSLYQKMYEKKFSLLLAEKIQTQFRERVSRRDRGVKREPLYVTSRVAMPSVLVELGFLTNPKEEIFEYRSRKNMGFLLFTELKEYKSEQKELLKKSQSYKYCLWRNK